MIDQLKPLIGKLTLFAKNKIGFQHPPRLFLRSDSENSQKMLGKTAHYDPQEKAITLFTHNRHPKDILRSYAHELVHHTQNLRGDLSPEKCGEMGQGYAQANGHMREMEREAYEKGNMCFRDWEDTLNDKDTYIMIKIAESKNLKENKSMTTKITKEFLKETIRKILSEGPQPTDFRAISLKKKNAAVEAEIAELETEREKAKEKAKFRPAAPQWNAHVRTLDAKIQKLSAQLAPAVDIDNATASAEPTFAASGASGTAPSVASQDLSGPNRSIDPSQDLSGPNRSIDPAAAAKPAAKKMSRRQLIRKRGAQTERLLPKYKPFNISNIKELQRVLVYLDILPPLQDNGDPQDDGKYGGGTMGAVQELQKQIGIPEPKRDGVWGPATTKAIKMDSELMKKLKSSEMEAKLAGLPRSGDKGSIPDAGTPDFLKELGDAAVQTPEQENSLYESRFAARNNRLFENLTKKWTK